MMNTPCKLYKRQYKKAKETLEMLEIRKAQIDFNLKSNPVCPDLHKELRLINLDIKITVNELEQAESDIEACESKYNFSEMETQLF